MAFHRAVRRALIAQLKMGGGPTIDGVVVPIYSSPPTNLKPPFVLVGSIVAEEPLSKGEPDSFYNAGVESWVQSNSPDQLDALCDDVSVRLEGVQLTSVIATLSAANLAQEQDSFNPDAPGGPILGRVQTFRLFAQP